MVKESKLPKKLYKYRKFNTSTLRLLSQAEVYCADPQTFNDPLDCRPVIRVDTDVPTLVKVRYRILVLARGKDKALAEHDQPPRDSTISAISSREARPAQFPWAPPCKLQALPSHASDAEFVRPGRQPGLR